MNQSEEISKALKKLDEHAWSILTGVVSYHNVIHVVVSSHNRFKGSIFSSVLMPTASSSTVNSQTEGAKAMLVGRSGDPYSCIPNKHGKE